MLVGIIGCGRLGKQLAKTLLKFCKSLKVIVIVVVGKKKGKIDAPVAGSIPLYSVVELKVS